jgi:hypothetical protein
MIRMAWASDGSFREPPNAHESARARIYIVELIRFDANVGAGREPA